MPQMSNLSWLPLLLFFSSSMYIIMSMLFTNTMIKKSNYKKFKSKNKNWQW
uniref:ATP synthase F0 subunit 8 n=1 Tax=Thoradonta yunnana TaxID=515186 RepID=UPI0023AA9B5D|nr:ATP synthase F0 subunit 8 [Thoradonta yunnana]WCF77153.1 ATP synthase F0 subunit 8 [Thoradonta yunnana]WCK12003.1 ATP synthase F0 subunit 8 [Thoradonta yunnana]